MSWLKEKNIYGYDQQFGCICMITWHHMTVRDGWPITGIWKLKQNILWSLGPRGYDEYFDVILLTYTNHIPTILTFLDNIYWFIHWFNQFSSPLIDIPHITSFYPDKISNIIFSPQQTNWSNTFSPSPVRRQCVQSNIVCVSEANKMTNHQTQTTQVWYLYLYI